MSLTVVILGDKGREVILYPIFVSTGIEVTLYFIGEVTLTEEILYLMGEDIFWVVIL